MPITQYPGRAFTFPCGHRTKLPDVGASDQSAYRCKNKGYTRHGTWRCAICVRKKIKQRQRGRGSDGLHGWAKILLRSLNYHALKGDYIAPRISISQLVNLRINSSKCALTGRPLNWAKVPLPHLHHNHRTGEVVGFVCSEANKTEGMLSKFTKEERRTLIRRSFPNEFDFGKESE